MAEYDDHRELATRAAEGDRVALERLLLAYYNEIERHIACRMPHEVQPALAVEDVLQQTFMQAFRDIGRFEPREGASFVAWLKAIADHRLQDAVKALRRQKRGGAARRVEGASATGDSSVQNLLDLLADDVESPSRVVAQDEALRAVRVAVAGLPDDQRDAVEQHCLAGRSLAETAAAMQRSPSAVRGLVHRAKQALREALGRSSRWLSGGRK